MKRIPLTRGKFALVDAADYSRVNQFKWRAHKCRRTWYAVRGTSTFMHRFLLNVEGKTTVDHKNGNGLDNRRKNLRPATRTQQRANQRPYTSRVKTSRFKGVFLRRWKKRSGGIGTAWIAVLQVNGKMYRQHCRTQREAARAYNRMARGHFGEYARLNKGA